MEGGIVSTNTAERTSAVPKKLNELTRMLTPLAIDSDRTYWKTLKWIDELAVLDKRTKDQDRFLETLTILVETYEDKHHQIDVDAVSPIEALEFLLKQHDLSGRDLGRILGQPQLGGKILRGERELSKNHIRKLCDYFKVSPELFL
jgi:HTH-type transcriptional regulator/antitoxin HigA